MKHYTNDQAGKTFIHFIAESKRNELTERLKKAKFFSLLLDGSTDKGNIDNEVCLVVWCNTNSSDEKIHTEMNYLTVCRPQSVTAEGLLSVLETILKHVGIDSLDSSKCHRLVGIRTDGASANIAARGLKGLVEKPLPWIFWMWCLAHRLELAIKDALKGTFFDSIDGMLIKLYYLYETSPKKYRELTEVISDLKDCFPLMTRVSNLSGPAVHDGYHKS